MNSSSFEEELRRVADPVTKGTSLIDLAHFLLETAPEIGVTELMQTYEGNSPIIEVHRSDHSFVIRPVRGIMGALCARFAKIISDQTERVFNPSTGDGIIVWVIDECETRFRVTYNHLDAPLFVRIQKLPSGVA